MTDVFIRERRAILPRHPEESHMKKEAEIGEKLPHTREGPEPAEPGRSQA